MRVSEYAKKIGRSRQLVTRWCAKGKILEKAVTKRDPIDINPEVADMLIRDNLDYSKSNKEKLVVPNKEPIIGEEPMGTYQEALVAEKWYAAKLKKVKLEKESNLYLVKAEVRKDAFECGRAVRDAIMLIPSRVSSILAAESEEFKIDAILTKELTQALEELNEEIKG